MATERNIEIALASGLLVSEEVERAEQHAAEQQAMGNDISVWAAARELDLIDAREAEKIERRHSTEELGTPNIEGYNLIDKLGSGGMGEVFLGINNNDEESAVKLLPARLVRDSEYIGRFQREVEAMKALNHPHIVRYIGNGTHNGRPYIMMEIVRGVSLKDHILQQGALGEVEVRVLMRQMSEALQAAWDVGLVHRDVKPANILLGPPLPGSDDPFCAKLCDFGLAKFNRENEGDPLTHTGIAIGTPHYMSPEQATGDRSADPRHDVYGLAATVYHALQGKTLYTGRSSAVIMYKHATARLDMRPLRERRIGDELISLLEAMLAKPKEVRLPNFDAVIERMDELPGVISGRTRSPIVITERRHLTKKHQQHCESKKAPLVAGGSSRPRRATSPAGLVLAIGAVVLLVAGLFLTLTEGTGTQTRISATPETLARVMAEAGSGHQKLIVELAAGAYQGPLHFGSNRPFELQVPEGRALIMSPDGAALDDPLITVAAAGDVVLRGISIRDALGPAIGVGPGARCEIIGGEVRGCASIGTNEGELMLTGATIIGAGGGLVSKSGSVLAIEDSLLIAQDTVITSDQSVLTIRRSRVAADGKRAEVVLAIDGGSVVLDRLIVDGSGRATGIEMRHCALVELVDVATRSSMTGISMTDVRAGVAQRVSVQAQRIGVEWQGPQQNWTWSQLAIQATQPMLGFEGVDAGGSGADPQALVSIPGDLR